MRAQPFLQTLQRRYTPTTARRLASTEVIRGGWEVWFQVEIALVFADYESRVCVREERFPSGSPAAPYIHVPSQTGQAATTTSQKNSAAKCDFFMTRAGGGDPTFVELKCIIPDRKNPIKDAWDRFRDDVNKLERIEKVNPAINGIAALATYGEWDATPDLPGSAEKYAYVWDPHRDEVVPMDKVQKYAPSRFFVVATTIK